YAWFDTSGMADAASNFKSLWDNYVMEMRDSSLFSMRLAATIDSLSTPNLPPPSSDSTIFPTELALTKQFFKFAQKAYEGNENLNMQELEWFIPRKKIQSVDLLDSLIASKGKVTNTPNSKQYYLLEAYLKKYYTIEKETGWPEIVSDQKKY